MCFRKLSKFWSVIYEAFNLMELKLYDVKVHINVANYGNFVITPLTIAISNLVKEMKVKLFIKPARLVNISLAGLKYLIVSLNAVTRPQ